MEDYDNVYLRIKREARELKTLTVRILPLLKVASGPMGQSVCYSKGRKSDATTSYLPFRGIVLIDNFQEISENDFQGAFCGERLLLSDEGAYFLQERVGWWSDLPKEETLWESEFSQLSYLGVINYYGFSKVVDGLLSALESFDGSEEYENRLQGHKFYLQTLQF